MSLKRLSIIAHKALAGSMAIWLSGVMFLLCCHLQNASAADMEFCPLARLGGHCDKAEKEKDSEKVSNPYNEQGIDCCAFIPAFFDKTRTFDTNQQVAVAASQIAIEKPKLIPVQASFRTADPYFSVFLPKNNTFLKNQTFRI